MPARIVQVTDIPRTRSGKITELAVRDVVHGREVKNKEALANPEALDQFADRLRAPGLKWPGILFRIEVTCMTYYPVDSFVKGHLSTR